MTENAINDGDLSVLTYGNEVGEGAPLPITNRTTVTPGGQLEAGPDPASPALRFIVHEQLLCQPTGDCASLYLQSQYLHCFVGSQWRSDVPRFLTWS